MWKQTRSSPFSVSDAGSWGQEPLGIVPHGHACQAGRRQPCAPCHLGPGASRDSTPWPHVPGTQMAALSTLSSLTVQRIRGVGN